MAAEMPTPAEQLSERRMLQLQLLTNRKDAGPAQTWSEDVARVLGAPYDASAARRLQGVLKVLLKR
jgi:ATP-dependent RNA helicase SUPV3L1/SUV3